VYIRAHKESRRTIKKLAVVAKRNSNKWTVFTYLCDSKSEAVRCVPLAIQSGDWGAALGSDLRLKHLQQRRLTELKLVLRFYTKCRVVCWYRLALFGHVCRVGCVYS
jgi:hypothetical protein